MIQIQTKRIDRFLPLRRQTGLSDFLWPEGSLSGALELVLTEEGLQVLGGEPPEGDLSRAEFYGIDITGEEPVFFSHSLPDPPYCYKERLLLRAVRFYQEKNDRKKKEGKA